MKALLTLNVADTLFANPKRINLLQKIAETGSISQGAKLSGISYKSAWDAIHAMNQQLAEPVIHSEKGGKGGGGAQLTAFGQRLLKVYEITGQVQNMALQALLDDSVPMNDLLNVMAHFSLKTSARNQLIGKIIAIDANGLNDLIKVRLNCGQTVSASVTHASRQKLQLEKNKSVLLLFKAPAVKLVTTLGQHTNMNYLKGKVINQTTLDTITELTVNIGEHDIIYASIQNQSLNGLDLTLGQSLYVCFDVSQVIIASMDEIG